MRHATIFTVLTLCFLGVATSTPTTKAQHPSSSPLDLQTNISLPLFAELEELSRIVDISYCVGTTGISHPFQCASRCDEFPTFELVDTFNTGPLMSDSCGYLAGTYSLANTIVDLSTVPQEYIPYPEDPQAEKPKHPEGEKKRRRRFRDWLPGHWIGFATEDVPRHETDDTREKTKCDNCTVHSGFWTSWQNTRPFVVPHLKNLRERYPNYRLDLVGHSLGGAVAALAGLEFQGLDWKPYITTFGEPKVGNSGLRNFIDETFSLPSEHLVKSVATLHSGRYRRITHVDDPVPLLPLQEWGYRSHAGEIYISKAELQPNLADLRLCYGDEDLQCMAGAEADASWLQSVADFEIRGIVKLWGIPIPARYKIWQLFFAHRDYFWRLGLCVPGGDPLDWGRGKYDFGDDGKEEL
ncbi:Alpha/Beta hydrolase protein [Halenospora varia]|nr:Alpha/Beta hydrolase protein [Halenospora varia]